MKLHVLSDLHTEFADFDPPRTDADVVVLAGDIGVGMSGLTWAGARFTETPVVYVPGNHEFYRHDVDMIEELKAAAPPNIHVLNDDAIVLEGSRFLGSVLWTDFALFGEGDRYFSMQRARHEMNDFFVIRQNGAPFTPADSVALHETSRAWLEGSLAETFDGTTIVVTHHAPSSRSVPRRFATDPLTPAFASRLETLMDGDRVALWIHGHTHDPFDYELHGTRVVCNPRGYPNENGPETFRADLVVRI